MSMPPIPPCQYTDILESIQSRVKRKKIRKVSIQQKSLELLQNPFVEMVKTH